MFDMLRSALQGDETCGSTKVRVDRANFEIYRKQRLWCDSSAPLASDPSLLVLAKGRATPSILTKHQRYLETTNYKVTQDLFDEIVADYWRTSRFAYTGGEACILDLQLALGHEKSESFGTGSPDAEVLQAFKHFSHLVTQMEFEQLDRFDHARNLVISFFHVFDHEDSSKMNIHTHNLMFLV